VRFPQTAIDQKTIVSACPVDDSQQGICAWNDDSMTSRDKGNQKRVGQLVVSIEDSPEARLIAAGMWARATALRDQLPEAVSAEEKLAGIEASLAGEGSQLILARTILGAEGFAVLVPRERIAEVLYLAVDPDSWGRGGARALLGFIRGFANEMMVDLELWVIADNERAVRTYERAGWVGSSDLAVRNASGRVERRFTLSR
jgi:GNAT superfamily N-acetyltransferase